MPVESLDHIPTIILPHSAQPNFQCDVCGELFWERTLHGRHVARCVRRNEDVLAAMQEAHKHRDPLYDATDFEAVEWQRKRYGLF